MPGAGCIAPDFDGFNQHGGAELGNRPAETGMLGATQYPMQRYRNQMEMMDSPKPKPKPKRKAQTWPKLWWAIATTAWA
jgi:hypothetical protein